MAVMRRARRYRDPHHRRNRRQAGSDRLLLFCRADGWSSGFLHGSAQQKACQRFRGSIDITRAFLYAAASCCSHAASQGTHRFETILSTPHQVHRSGASIGRDPGEVFAADRAANTAWNLWQAVERSGKESRASGWNRRFIEAQFGKEVAGRLRETMMAAWRKDRPTLRSERPDDEKNSFLVRWQFGLAAIAAEARHFEETHGLRGLSWLVTR